eukprot:TRINITY_DN65877_c6_g2_i1.p1 TRINITY_DN65877_c6_g2~~TRINITY_DN65877_c6_g2_i1.p1  ORF type:complete len:331 (+),score=156.05 TRINITY_DN65877_c6_g2_i1:34-993(+)
MTTAPTTTTTTLLLLVTLTVSACVAAASKPGESQARLHPGHAVEHEGEEVCHAHIEKWQANRCSEASKKMMPSFIAEDVKLTAWQGKPKITCQKNVQKIYQLGKDFNDIMTKNNICYFIGDGTVLGAVRHGGLIPWDDDIDVAVDAKHEDKLLSLKDEFAEAGYTLMRYYGFYKLFLTEGSEITGDGGKPFKYPFMDVFIWEKDGDKYVRKRCGLWPDCWYKVDEVFPIKKCTFGELELPCPNKPKPFLDRCYNKDGNDWRTVGYHGKDHETYNNVKEVNDETKLSKSMMKPALPKDPLKEHVKMSAKQLSTDLCADES